MSESATSSLMANLRAKKAGAQGSAVSATPPNQGNAGSSPASTDTALSPSSPPEPLGINPPEKDLPAPEPAKRGPGRPRKEKAVEVSTPEADPKQFVFDFSKTAIDYDKLAILIVDELVMRLAKPRGAE